MIRISEQFKKEIPPLSRDEYAQLEENCLSEGIRDAIITWDDYIIDGHNRYNIALKHNLSYNIAEKEFKTEDDVLLWIIDNQNGRRNLTDGWKYKLSERKRSILHKRGEEKKVEDGKEARNVQLGVLSIVDKTHKPKHNTQKIIASSLGWSTGKTAMADVVFKKAPEKVQEKVLSGEVSINEAYKEIKNEIKQEKKRVEKEIQAEEGSKITITRDDIDIKHGDFIEVLSHIPDGSLDLILTDPPYPFEFIDCWSKLSLFASKKLKPNGFCIAYSGQTNLVDVMIRMSEHLDYYWTFSLIHTGQKQLIKHRNIFCGWKPLLVFQNGKRKQDNPCEDIITGTGMEKSFHKWQQAEAELIPLIEHFTKIGDTICDPFLGGGTTAVVSRGLKRKFIGAEIEEQQFNIAKRRIYAER